MQKRYRHPKETKSQNHRFHRLKLNLNLLNNRNPTQLRNHLRLSLK